MRLPKMRLEKRDWFWIIGMAIVCSGLGKRGWSEPTSAMLGGLIGVGLGLVISKATKRTTSRLNR
jgi:hypothetical protein